MSDTPTTPAGWYDDGSGRRRYWDGAAWTDHYETPAASPTASEPTAPTQAYGSGTTDAYGQAPTQAYGSGSTDAYGQAPTQAYGSGTTDAYGQAPTQAYGADQATSYPPPTQAPYAAAPYGAPQQGYGAPGYAPPRSPQASDSKPSVLGLIALGIAVLGLILAFIPFANVGGWVLLPVALVLAIIAFFLKGRKWPAIAALIVSVVGGIVSIVIAVLTFLAFAAAVSDLPDFTDTESTVAPPSETSDTGESTPDTETGDGSVGSIDNPAPIGSTITGQEYTVVINSVALNADAEITGLGYPAADDGLSYVLINATVTYTGSESPGSGLFVNIGYEAPDGTTYSYGDNDAFPPDPDINFAELPAGQPVTGNTVLAIPVAADGALTVSPGFLDDTVYVALR